MTLKPPYEIINFHSQNIKSFKFKTTTTTTTTKAIIKQNEWSVNIFLLRFRKPRNKTSENRLGLSINVINNRKKKNITH